MSANGQATQALPIRSGHSSEQGIRPTMEDEVLLQEKFHIPGRGHFSLFGVFDGHGGRSAAIYTRDHLLEAVSAELRAGRAPGDALARAYVAVDTAFITECRAAEEAQHAAALAAQQAAAAAAAAARAAAAAANGVVLTPPAPHRRQRSANLAVRIPTSTPHLLPSAAASLRSSSAAVPSSHSMASSLQLDEPLKDTSGTTAVTALLHHESYTLYVANVGDSRAVLARQNAPPLALTNDHKADRPDEMDRIRRAGGFVVHKRVMGELAISRAIGDADFKGDGFLFVLAEPELCTQSLSASDDLLLLACDGLFDVMSNDQACTFIRDSLAAGKSLQATSEALVRHTIDNLSTRDNVTVVIVQLPSADELKAAGVQPNAAATDVTEATFQDSHVTTPAVATPATPLAAQTLFSNFSPATSTVAVEEHSSHSGASSSSSAASALPPAQPLIGGPVPQPQLQVPSASASSDAAEPSEMSSASGLDIQFHDEAEDSGAAMRDGPLDSPSPLMEEAKEEEQEERSHSRSHSRAKSDEKQQIHLGTPTEARG